jgi:hypothetical protein
VPTVIFHSKSIILYFAALWSADYEECLHGEAAILDTIRLNSAIKLIIPPHIHKATFAHISTANKFNVLITCFGTKQEENSFTIAVVWQPLDCP